MATIRVLTPVGESQVSQSAPPALPGALAGKTVGFLDNTKANFEQLARHMADLLAERHGVGRMVFQRKANAASPASAEVLAALRGVDLVVTGSAD
jgi:pseudouridine-5'-phosphate glycosidase